ncbi:MAG: radical SAM protein [Planctomycetota bacterium]|jgi:putative pyruvate formate lyase activating enzyme
MNHSDHKQAIDRSDQALKALRNCKLCPRNCRVNRKNGEKGYCGLYDSAHCFREMLHLHEEQMLVPSHQIYFAGCNLRCQFCSVSEWNEEPFAAPIMDIDQLIKAIAHRKSEGAKNINLLGGEPAVSLAGILELLAKIPPETQVVWNSNMFYSDIVNELTEGLIDVYLADIKCGNDKCAQKLLGVDNYLQTVKKNTLWATEHASVIVRHLILPGHTECCLKPVLAWLGEELPHTDLSLRGNYVPPAEINSAPADYLKAEQLQRAEDLAGNLGLNLVQ